MLKIAGSALISHWFPAGWGSLGRFAPRKWVAYQMTSVAFRGGKGYRGGAALGRTLPSTRTDTTSPLPALRMAATVAAFTVVRGTGHAYRTVARRPFYNIQQRVDTVGFWVPSRTLCHNLWLLQTRSLGSAPPPRPSAPFRWPRGLSMVGRSGRRPAGQRSRRELGVPVHENPRPLCLSGACDQGQVPPRVRTALSENSRCGFEERGPRDSFPSVP